MNLHDYASHDAVGLRRLIAAAEVTPAEVEAAAREALAAADSAVRGLARPLLDRPLDHAPDGPFAHIPFLLKDLGPVAEGLPFAIGSRAIPDIPAREDSHLMRRFRAAGLAVLGQTTTPEFGLSFATEPIPHGPTRNPWDLALGVGGSSGGSAALVAAGAVPMAHGGDGAGSLRIPASCCGLVGLKPSRGRVGCGPGLGEPMLGMAYEFGLTRTVRDTAALLDAVHGGNIGDKYIAPPPARTYTSELTASPAGLRIALSTAAPNGAPVDPDVAAVAVHTAHVLEDMGHTVTEAAPRVEWPDVIAATLAEGVAMVAPVLGAPRPPDPAKLEAVSRSFIAYARSASALDLLAAFDAQNRVTRSLAGFLGGAYDLLVTPTLAAPPLPHGTLDYDSPEYTAESWLERIFAYGPFTMLFNISGQPAISLPLGTTPSGLPVGVQIAAAYGREDLLIAVAARLEEALPWRDRRPPHHVGV